MFFRLIRRFSIVTLPFCLLLVAASGIFAYLVSPLRDSTFQPNSANAGSLVPWLQGVSEGDWLLGANILATLLATNVTLVLYQWSLPVIANPTDYWQQGLPRGIAGLMSFIIWFGIWLVLLSGSWYVFLIYLLCQWLVD